MRRQFGDPVRLVNKRQIENLREQVRWQAEYRDMPFEKVLICNINCGRYHLRTVTDRTPSGRLSRATYQCVFSHPNWNNASTKEQLNYIKYYKSDKCVKADSLIKSRLVTFDDLLNINTEW